MEHRLVSNCAERAGLGAGAAVALRQIGGDDVVPAPILAGGTAAADAISPASTIKVPIAAALAERFATGELAPTERVTILAANMTLNDGISPFAPGYAATLEELVTLMIVRSDNVATNTLIDVLGRDAISARGPVWGLRNLAVRRKLSGVLPLIDDPEASGRNVFPADDAARLYERIANDPRLAALVPILLAQEWNEKLPRGLASEDRFAHKTGDTDEVSHDGGILTIAGVDGRVRSYAIAVAAPLPSAPENDAHFAAFARELRPYLARERISEAH